MHFVFCFLFTALRLAFFNAKTYYVLQCTCMTLFSSSEQKLLKRVLTIFSILWLQFCPSIQWNHLDPTLLTLIIWTKQHRDIFHYIFFYVPQKKVTQVWNEMLQIMTGFHFLVNYPFKPGFITLGWNCAAVLSVQVNIDNQCIHLLH